MNPTTKAAIEFIIDKYKLRRDHDTAGNLLDALKNDGQKIIAQHLTEAMATKDYLSRSTLISHFLRDIETDIQPDATEGHSKDEFDQQTRIGIDPACDKPSFSTKCFVVNPAGDSQYHAASREAMRAYAFHIQGENRALANEVRSWADKETLASLKRQAEKASK